MISLKNNLAPFALTMGDPAGIGPWVVAQLWQTRREQDIPTFCWFGDPSLMEGAIPTQIISTMDEALGVFDKALPIIPCNCVVRPVPGQFDPKNSAACVQSIRMATELALKGDVAGVVTSPISKEIFEYQKFPFAGHTEFIASLCGAQGQEVMMLANQHLRVVLGTVHIALKTVPSVLTQEKLLKVASVTAKALKKDFGIKSPKIAVAGLNPHAGENGMLGEEEKLFIIPAIEEMKKLGIDATGPYPADTMFMPQVRTTYDAALCMYHDQGLIPLKTLDMIQGVNITLGLPIVRTSPDHGTAYDKAVFPREKGTASIESTYQALIYAQRIVQNRIKYEG